MKVSGFIISPKKSFRKTKNIYRIVCYMFIDFMNFTFHASNVQQIYIKMRCRFSFSYLYLPYGGGGNLSYDLYLTFVLYRTITMTMYLVYLTHFSLVTILMATVTLWKFHVCSQSECGYVPHNTHNIHHYYPSPIHHPYSCPIHHPYSCLIHHSYPCPRF
jgi:hypothetical protein